MTSSAEGISARIDEAARLLGGARFPVPPPQLSGELPQTEVDQLRPPVHPQLSRAGSSPPVFSAYPNEALVVAIAQARVEFADLEKSAQGMIGKRTFNYAPLGDMVRVTEKALAAHGVGFVMPIRTEGDRVYCELIVQGHGGCFRTGMDAKIPTSEDKGRGGFKLEDTWIQELGRITTYLRRYLFNSFWGLDTVEDKDSDGVKERPARFQKDEQAETPAQRESAKVVERTKDAGNPPDPKRFTVKTGEDLKEALGAARKNLAWDRQITLGFIRDNFNGKSSSDLTEAEQAQLLGMMEDLYAAQRDNDNAHAAEDAKA